VHTNKKKARYTLTTLMIIPAERKLFVKKSLKQIRLSRYWPTFSDNLLHSFLVDKTTLMGV
jgi:hypothetical protein